MHYTVCLKKCQEREHLRTLESIKPVGQKKEFTFVWATFRSAVASLPVREVLNVEFYKLM